MLWDCMLRRWLGSAEEPVDQDDTDTQGSLREQRVTAEARYAEMRAFLRYPS